MNALEPVTELFFSGGGDDEEDVDDGGGETREEMEAGVPIVVVSGDPSGFVSDVVLLLEQRIWLVNAPLFTVSK